MNVSITYHKNPGYSDANAEVQPRLFAELDLSNMGIHEKVDQLAIYFKKLSNPVGPIRVLYSTSIAGLTIEAGNLSRLEQRIAEMIKQLVRFQCLPEYLFQVGENAWPIYLVNGQLLTRYPGGPVFSSQDIASLRLWLADHFKSLERIRNRRDMDLLFLSPFDLKLYAPYCVLRTLDEDLADIPIFPRLDHSGLRLLAPINGTSFSAFYENGRGVFRLWDAVAERLIQQGRISESSEITLRKLPSEAWEALKAGLIPVSNQFTYLRERDGQTRRLFLPVYQIEYGLIASRVNRVGRAVLYRAPDLLQLQKRVGEDLHYWGHIDRPGEIEMLDENSEIPYTAQLNPTTSV
jgi:hypothetical protein